MANKKAEILTMDGQVVSPITLATNVLLDDGRTAQDLLDSRDESMFSPTITTSSSISKVGQGDNVDFSENVIDGAYKSCVLKGKTLVNYNAEGNDRNEYVCMPSVEGESVTVNGTVEGLVKSAILKGQTLVNISKFESNIERTSTGASQTIYSSDVTMLKTSATYTFIYWIESTSGTSVSNITTLDGSDTQMFDRKILQSRGNLESNFILKFSQTSRDFTGHYGLKFSALNGSVKLVKSVILEGDYTNVDIPYFEGMQSVKMPVLTATGKNIFSEDDSMELGAWTTTGGNYQTTSEIRCKNNFIPFPKQLNNGDKMYIVLSDTSINSNTNMHVYDENKKYLGNDSGCSVSLFRNGVATVSIRDITKCCYFSFRAISTNTDCKFALMINEPSPYEPHKSNILTVNEDVELRGIGDVQDTLDCLTGEVVEYIGEITLDGNQNFIAWGSYGFYISDSALTSSSTSQCINNKYPSYINASALSKATGNGIAVNSGKLYIKTNEFTDVNEFVIYLKTNPITVQYQLATKSIKTVDLSDNHVYSYKDTTHYTCSSQEGSLLPTLAIEEGVKYKTIIKPSTKYSVVFNRTEVASGLTVDLGGATTSVTSSTLGKNIVQITTPPTLSHNYVIFKGLGNVIKDVQVIEGDVADDVEYFEGMVDVKNPVMTNCNMLDVDGADYKSNTISTNEVILRSLPNGVCDTLDLETGEYVQRIGEMILDGSETWVLGTIKEKTQVFHIPNNSDKIVDMKKNTLIMCDKLKVTSGIDDEAISLTETIYLALLKSKASTVEELKVYLSQNPITVQYELKTPITTTIDLKQHPFAYKDGYAVLTSSSEEVSLTPTIEYSLIANRLGQIQSNQKLVEKQQTQIDELESMVIANLVNTQYQQALNEIKLGVK